MQLKAIIGRYFFDNNVDQYEYQKMIDLVFYLQLRDNYELPRKKIYPHKPIKVQKLAYGHQDQQLGFYNRLKTLNINPYKIWFSDEKIFCLTRRKNHQNCRFLAHFKLLNFVNELDAHSP